ncbi:L-2-hydroxyglutarate oxidase LhgO [Brevibacterium sanguinis]|uniref:L-2-hydroxyglutarate oxidase LhgO n=2 Tax=Brevibacterium TaxID=1696 RepID=A0A366IMK6_9MICO|nr:MULTISPECIES: L-2-hydroxyglutarate oxidase [Brevibacterium]RBP61705.1 L-2-hydroxyglutarate oxidase LhgO [Brevibacterium sanguinis]RBP74314.1 L-2-hydroxyglutarate oxidase LhgO [Brevibacterium celere]
MRKRFAVIGAGIIGAAVARGLQSRHDDAEVTLYEKEDGPAAHQTGHNSGVIHAGLYYEPGSLKARLCRRGVSLLLDFAREHDVAFDECGKIVVATDDIEVDRLHAIHERAVANGVPNVSLLDADGLREIEPNAVGLAALHSPHTGIIDYRGLTEALVADFRRGGGRVRFSTPVDRVEEQRRRAIVHTHIDSQDYDQVIVCAGLQSDRLATRSGESRDPSVVPFFGQYFILAPEYDDVVNGLIYPVPDPRYPFLGVHVTRRIDGGVMLGPNAFLSFSREGYHGLGFDLADSLRIAANPGFWRFAAGNMATARREIGGVLSSRRFVEEAAKYVPLLAGVSGHRATRGIRAQAMKRDGTLVDDFVIDRTPATMFVRNAPSPGATSALAIAEHLIDQADAD